MTVSLLSVWSLSIVLGFIGQKDDSMFTICVVFVICVRILGQKDDSIFTICVAFVICVRILGQKDDSMFTICAVFVICVRILGQQYIRQYVHELCERLMRGGTYLRSIPCKVMEAGSAGQGS